MSALVPQLGAEDPVLRQVPWQVARRHCCKEKLPLPTESLQYYIMNPQAVSLVQQRDRVLYQEAEGVHMRR